ncbi:MAG: low affinity iron permease family protein [Planctomycetes bacterium]|nr:low affinity iron permease family protein [Planctomycetota bacterium]
MTRKIQALERLARRITDWTGSSVAFVIALGSVFVWLAVGPFVDPPFLNSNYQLIINTGTTVVTFLMVFLIQRAQNKDSQAVHLKLNELLAAVQGASNRLISVEDLSEAELHTLHKHFKRLVELAKTEQNLTESHSIEEAQGRHHTKRAREKT